MGEEGFMEAVAEDSTAEAAVVVDSMEAAVAFMEVAEQAFTGVEDSMAEAALRT